MEFFCCIHSGHELECIKRLASRIHLLEDETDRCPTCVLAQLDHRHLILVEVSNHALHEGIDQLQVVAPLV